MVINWNMSTDWLSNADSAKQFSMTIYHRLMGIMLTDLHMHTMCIGVSNVHMCIAFVNVTGAVGICFFVLPYTNIDYDNHIRFLIIGVDACFRTAIKLVAG